MVDHDDVPTAEVVLFGDDVVESLARALGTGLVGVYFVGSVALGGYVPGETDLDMAAVSENAVTGPQKQRVASAIVEASAACPTASAAWRAAPRTSLAAAIAWPPTAREGGGRLHCVVVHKVPHRAEEVDGGSGMPVAPLLTGWAGFGAGQLRVG